MGRGTGCAVLALSLAIACSGSNQPHQVGSRAAASSPAAAAAGAQWEQLGATQAPPASLGGVSTGGAAVVNQTQGAVSDADARAWVGDLMRTFALLSWAVSADQDRFLLRSGLSTAPVAVFQPNVRDIAQARAAGARVEYRLQTFRRFVVRAVPASVQPSVQRVGEAWSAYAIYLDAVGPAGTDWVDGSGHRTVKSQVGAGAPLFELIGGASKRDPVMGEIWVMSFDLDCTAASTRQTVAPLCNP